MVAGTGIGSQQIRDGKSPCENSQGCKIPILQTLRNFRNPHAKSASSTSDGHNFLVRTPICAFLDSMESFLSLESNHMPVNGIWCSHLCFFYALFKELCWTVSD